jgi:hypothetical protein
MGNANSSRQKIENIIETHMTAEAYAKSDQDCNQTMSFENATLIGCKVLQSLVCKTNVAASLESVISALQSAELSNEAKQKIDGIVASMNVNVNDMDSKQHLITKVEAECKATSYLEASQKMTYKNTTIDCRHTDGKTPDIHQTQYTDASVSCVVDTLVDIVQENKQTNTTHQENIGLKLPELGGILIIIVILGAGAMKMKSKMKKGGGGAGLPLSPHLRIAAALRG